MTNIVGSLINGFAPLLQVGVGIFSHLTIWSDPILGVTIQFQNHSWSTFFTPY